MKGMKMGSGMRPPAGKKGKMIKPRGKKGE